jgi:hypothetical protein
MMWRVVVAKYALSLTDRGLSIVDAHGIAQFGADHFVEVEKRAVPEKDATTDKPVIVIRSQAGGRLLYLADLGVLA